MFKRLPEHLRAPLWLVLLGLLLFAAYWILFTREYQELDKGWSKAARSNPYLAAQLYLSDKTHLTWRSHQALQNIADGRLHWQGNSLGPGDSLIIADGYGSLSADEAEHLLSWVHQGGHLLYHLGNPFVDLNRIETDPILEQLGLELGDADTQLEVPAPAAAQPPATTHYVLKLPAGRICDQSATARPIALPDKPLPLLVDLGPGRTLLIGEDSQAPLWLAGSDATQAAAAGFTLGAGRISLLSNLSAWHNNRLDCADHGYFLQSLLGPGQQVAWFINLDAPSLWQRLWALAPEAVLASLLALVAWLWQVNVRFGEPLVDNQEQRRAFLDHFKAWANYLARPPLIEAEIAALRQDCLKRAARRVPGFHQLTPAEQILRLEQLSGLTAPLLLKALRRPVEHQAHTITDIIAALQHLRNHL